MQSLKWKNSPACSNSLLCSMKTIQLTKKKSLSKASLKSLSNPSSLKAMALAWWTWQIWFVSSKSLRFFRPSRIILPPAMMEHLSPTPPRSCCSHSSNYLLNNRRPPSSILPLRTRLRRWASVAGQMPVRKLPPLQLLKKESKLLSFISMPKHSSSRYQMSNGEGQWLRCTK